MAVAAPAFFVYVPRVERRGGCLEGFVALHPAWMTFAWLFDLILATLGNLNPIALVISWALLQGVLWLWNAGVYRTSARILGKRIREYEAILFIACVGLVPAPVWMLFVQPTTGVTYQLYTSPVPRGFETARYVVDSLLLVWMLSSITSVWVAASSLILFERQRVAPRPAYTTFATFIVALFFPIGIWALSWRVRRMLASYQAAPTSNTPVRARSANQR